MSALSNETANLLQRVEALRGQYERGPSESLTARAASEWRAARDANKRKAQPLIAPERVDFEQIEQIEQIEQREIADANPWPKPDQRIVEDGRASPPTLDNDAQPAGWGEWIAKEAAARDCPRDYLAAALIGAASAWIGNSRHVAANETWSEPPHLWLALIGAPSTGKTPALRAPDGQIESRGIPVGRRM
jgi:hypothetical protein